MGDSTSLTPEEFKNLDEATNTEESEAENTAEESTPKKPQEEEPDEPRIPYSRFEEVNRNLKEAKDAISRLEEKSEQKVLTADEQQSLEAKKYLRGILQEVMTEREAEQKAAEEKAIGEFEAESQRLSGIYKDFDADKVTKFANNHDIDDLEKAYWRMRATERGSAETPKPKIPKAPGTAETVEKDKVDYSGLDPFRAVQAWKEAHGVK